MTDTEEAANLQNQQGIPHANFRSLFHYTSFEGLRGIVESGTMWASNLRFSNDPTEGSYRRVRLAKDLKAHAEAQETDLEAWREIYGKLARYIRSSDFGPYAICFCKDGDLLSQWRHYGRGGCAIGLSRPETLRREGEVPVNPLYPNTGSSAPLALDGEFFPMEYGSSGYRRVLSAMTSLTTAPNGPSLQARDTIDYQLIGLAGHGVGRLKHGKFREEKETRYLLMLPRYGTGGPAEMYRRYRVGGDRLIPYVTVPINLRAVTSLVIGPGPDQKREYRAAKMLAHDYLPDCVVTRSKVPFSA